jgi:integrase
MTLYSFIQRDMILRRKEERSSSSSSALSFEEEMIELATAGLERNYSTRLTKLDIKANVQAIVDFISCLKTETNLSDNHRRNIISLLTRLSRFLGKPFVDMTRQDIISFLDRIRKPEAADPLHRWIGTYNMYRGLLVRFFRWLYYPDMECDKRPKPSVIQDIPQLKRKETSIYKPSHIWTAEDDVIFLRYCPSKRMKCYHAAARDTSCRPHELLKIRLKDIAFKTM